MKGGTIFPSKRLKWMADIRPSGVDKHSLEGETAVLLCNYTDVYKNDRIESHIEFMEATAPNDQIVRFSLRKNDVIITKDSETPADIATPALVADNIEGLVCGYHLSLLRPKNGVSGAFLFWALKSREVSSQFSLAAQGVTRFGITTGATGLVRLPAPEFQIQCAIAAFLDRETARIDGMIKEQHYLLSLIAEKRRAAISHAVMQGLDPSVQMKDSGVRWLGRVPAHWDVVQLGRHFREVTEEGEFDLPILSVSIHSGVSDKELSEADLERKVTRSEDRSTYARVRPDDLVYNMMRAWQGGFGTVRVEGMVSPAYVVVRPRGGLRTEFVELLLRTPNAIVEMKGHSKGIIDFRLRLYWSDGKQIKVVVPPLPEQDAILEHLQKIRDQLDELADEARRSIALLKERRAALISAAVTGKIDVRGLVAASQDEREAA